MRIEVSRQVSAEVAAKLEEGLRVYNTRIAGDDCHELLSLVARRGSDVLGGLLGGTYWGYLYIRVLIIDEQYRGEGVGSKLLLEAEHLARNRGCRHACLDTHDFQGVDFYKRHGYEIAGKLPELPPGHVKYILHKLL